MSDLMPKLLELLTAVTGFLAALKGLFEAETRTGLKIPGYPVSDIRPVIENSNLAEIDKKALKRVFGTMRLTLIISALTFVIILFIVVYGWIGNRFLAWALVTHDPAVFFTSGDDLHIARIFISREELEKYGRYGDIIRDSNSSFDLLTISAGSTLDTYESAIDDTLRAKNVTIRILIFKADKENDANCRALGEAIGEECDALEQRYNSAARILKHLGDSTKNVAVYRGRIEFRAYKRLVLYTMWLRDADGPGASGHIEVEQYQQGKRNWPSFTFARDSGPLIGRLHKEFETVWNQSTSID